MDNSTINPAPIPEDAIVPVPKKTIPLKRILLIAIILPITLIIILFLSLYAWVSVSPESFSRTMVYFGLWIVEDPEKYDLNVIDKALSGDNMRDTQTLEVNGQAMFPNYKDGQYYTIDTNPETIATISRGDVIVHVSPLSPNTRLFKRVIAIPGDEFSLSDGNVYVNGILLDESIYLTKTTKTYSGSFMSNKKNITIPANQFFVMGDNRDYSSDSREWGLIERSKIIGKVDQCYKNCEE